MSNPVPGTTWADLPADREEMRQHVLGRSQAIRVSAADFMAQTMPEGKALFPVYVASAEMLVLDAMAGGLFECEPADGLALEAGVGEDSTFTVAEGGRQFVRKGMFWPLAGLPNKTGAWGCDERPVVTHVWMDSAYDRLGLHAALVFEHDPHTISFCGFTDTLPLKTPVDTALLRPDRCCPSAFVVFTKECAWNTSSVCTKDEFWAYVDANRQEHLLSGGVLTGMSAAVVVATIDSGSEYPDVFSEPVEPPHESSDAEDDDDE